MVNYESSQKHMRRTSSLDNHESVKGFDFDKKMDLHKFLESYKGVGFQGSELYKAISITRAMVNDDAKIFLSFTGNVISSGLRDVICFLVKNKMVDTIITTASGVEEDVVKSLNDFKLGSFDAPGRTLLEHGIGRIGNLFVPNDRYLYFERFMNTFLVKAFDAQKNFGRPLAPHEITNMIGKDLGKDSFLYWAYKNKINVFCPGLMDGSFGDITYFFRQKNKDFMIDVVREHETLINYVLQQEKTGALILGGGISKHYNLNAQIFREGFDYAVYLTTAHGFDGSDSGGNIEEAKSWAKVKVNAPSVKVVADFTITFPLLVASCFVKKK